MYSPRSPKGFTLIELLVVIAIIGILSAVVLASLGAARTRANDTARIAAIKQMQVAIEAYYADNGEYPRVTYFHTTPHNGDACGSGTWCTLETLLSPYIPSLPRDKSPENNSDGWASTPGVRYIYKRPVSAPHLYGLGVRLDASNSAAANDGGAYPLAFEVGPLVSYCKEKYSGTGGNWRSWDANLCTGGN